MAEYERDVSLEIGVDEAFRFLSDPVNMPTYIATMVSSQREDPNHLRVAAEVMGRHEEGSASFSTDPASHRMEWGAGANANYRGWLQISGSGAASTVTLHLSTDSSAEAAEVERALDQTVANIRERLQPG